MATKPVAPVNTAGPGDSAHNGNQAVKYWVKPGEAEAAKAHPTKDEVVPVFVGRAEWYHITYHICAAVASVPTLGLPGAMAGLGWPAGMITLILGGATTCYTSFLIARLHTYGGKRHIRYRDLGDAVLGRWGWWAVMPFQFAVCVGSTIANLIVAGQAMKAVNVICRPDNVVPLPYYIIVFGAVNLVLSQCPHMHSIRFINQLATFCTISFATVAVGLSAYAGNHAPAPRDYGVHGSSSHKLFGIFNSLGIMAFAYGNTVIPEIQATAKEPNLKTMKRGIVGAYTVILTAYLVVATVGYWAFGTDAKVIILQSLSYPSWAVATAWVFAAIQLTGTTQIYCQPIYEGFDKQLGNPLESLWSMRNLAVRLVCRTIFIVVCTVVAAMIPFFGDFMGLIGAIGYTPMDFVLPIFLWIVAYKPKGPRMWISLALACLYICVGSVAAVGAVRNIVVDSINYSLFANL
ncbi:hypothetical protein WJX72_008303 [[Myrmecia] bisecta]|uniref:Amino acid transporter transmembrane domain-containing protein n=1 Tax=[Myrmecia] bisecta TaxID=41462 RepID=A0AAW1PKB0_9CHLO